MLALAMLLCLPQVGQAATTNIQILHNLLTRECGFTIMAHNMIDERIAYRQSHCGILVVYSKGNVVSGTLIGEKGYNPVTARDALASIYLVLQGQNGKEPPRDFKRKIDRMIDTLVTTLKMNGRTKFNYDDLVVTSWVDDKGIFYISLTQW
jgi:hypothetical protein